MLTPCRRARVPNTFVRCEVYLLNNSIATQNVSVAVPIYVATLITLGTASGMVLFEVRHSEPCMPWRTDPHRVLGHELDPFHLWYPSSAGVPLLLRRRPVACKARTLLPLPCKVLGSLSSSPVSFRGASNPPCLSSVRVRRVGKLPCIDDICHSPSPSPSPSP